MTNYSMCPACYCRLPDFCRCDQPPKEPQKTYETGNRRYVREEDDEDNSEGA